MYVCICNRITDRQIRAEAPPVRCSVAEFYRSLGIKPKCGKCVEAVREIIEANAACNPMAENAGDGRFFQTAAG